LCSTSGALALFAALLLAGLLIALLATLTRLLVLLAWLLVRILAALLATTLAALLLLSALIVLVLIAHCSLRWLAKANGPADTTFPSITLTRGFLSRTATQQDSCNA
jgi:hypothetical protein